MTEARRPDLPQGYEELTEGRIRTTDLVFEKNASEWSEPHAFAVGSDVGADETQVARRGAAQSKGARSR
ncbi:MAG: hypothetical protein ABIQ60_06690 [Burkholderiaceae bacterium]